ncbi:MAG: hypothetical protein AABZ47_16840 [Planctomycetota bacterium]
MTLNCTAMKAFFIGSLAIAPAAFTQDAPQTFQPTEATIEKIMDQAVQNIKRRYNLNEDQARKTTEIMKNGVRKFLKDHEKEVWPAIRDLLSIQLNGKPPTDRELIMRIGKVARPLAKLAEQAIYEANAEWRQFLTEEQKRTHDFDLAEMRKTFSKIHANFESWESGTPTDTPILPPPEGTELSPPRPKLPSAGLPDPIVENRKIDLNVFDAIAEKFIKDYEPDETQLGTIRSIRDEYKAKADDFQTKHSQQLAEIATKLADAQTRKDHKERDKADAERKKLLEPFHLLVDQMETRLKSLLTTAQIERFAQKTRDAENKKGKLKATGARSTPTPSVSGKATTDAPQPAGTNNSPAAPPLVGPPAPDNESADQKQKPASGDDAEPSERKNPEE